MGKKKKSIYVHETETIWSDNGEVYLETDNNIIVFNADTLFKDLPSIVSLCHKETLKSFKETEKELNIIGDE